MDYPKASRLRACGDGRGGCVYALMHCFGGYEGGLAPDAAFFEVFC